MEDNGDEEYEADHDVVPEAWEPAGDDFGLSAQTEADAEDGCPHLPVAASGAPPAVLRPVGAA